MIMSAGRLLSVFLGLAFLLDIPQNAFGAAFIRGAYYRLGDADPGATPGTIGNNPTQDSFGDDLDLDRFDSPRYSSDVPPRGPWESKISMAFANDSLGGPAVPGFYGRQDSLPMVEQGYALEAWVKNVPPGLLNSPDGEVSSVVVYNGQPDRNGFGLFLSGDEYVARVGSFERSLGPATAFEWHHLAYVQSLGTAAYYYDGKLVHETTSDPLPSEAQGGFWLGGMAAGDNDEGAFLFNGWIDEVRYQSFNPLAAGSFNPFSFLIRDVPPGDFNADGAVDAADYVVWRRSNGAAADYSAWRTNFGYDAEPSPAAFTNAAVPEPASSCLFCLGLLNLRLFLVHFRRFA
jgi:Concanavalin A-like lectin/glucanases superfamily